MKKLSENQVRVLGWIAEPETAPCLWGYSGAPRIASAFWRGCDVLMARGLVARESLPRGGYAYRVTPAGRAVLASLADAKGGA